VTVLEDDTSQPRPTGTHTVTTDDAVTADTTGTDDTTTTDGATADTTGTAGREQRPEVEVIAPTPRSGRVGRTAKLVLPPVAVFLAVMGFWYLMSFVVLDPTRRFLLPPPHQVLVEGLQPQTRSDVLESMLLSAQVAFIGLAIAFGVGFVLAVLMSQAKWIERSLYPWAVFSQTVPILALVPLLGFWFGFGQMSRVIVCVVIAIFPIIINTLEGLLSADRRLHDLLTLKGASRWTRLTKLQVPAALPDIFVGLRTSAGLAVIGAIVGDFFFGKGEPGLGLLISRYNSRLQSEEMLAATAAACVLGVLVFAAFGLLGKKVVGAWDDSWAGGDHRS
jgi:NitT/TauT family transport system permease protein